MKPTPARQHANELLAEIADHTARLDSLTGAAEEEMEAVREKYREAVEGLGAALKTREKALVALMKRHTREFFGEGDRLALAAGVLCRMEELKVAIPRGALEEAKRHGLTDAIKTVESLDRAIVEKWPVERLTLIGASKKLKESYSYELKQLNS